MSSKRQLSVVITGSTVALLILNMGPVSSEVTLLHRGATADQYEAFNKHFADKFKNILPTIADAKDLWVVWAKDHNISDSESITEAPKDQGKTTSKGDSLFVPEVDGKHDHAYAALGVTRERKQALNSAVEAVGFGSTVSHVLSETSRIAESHAELLMIGYLVGSHISNIRKGGSKEAELRRILVGTIGRDGASLLDILDKLR